MGNLRQKYTEEEWDKLVEKNPFDPSYKPESGYFDLPVNDSCLHPNHNPPNNLYIPQGKGYNHVCPLCRAIVKVIPQQISF